MLKSEHIRPRIQTQGQQIAPKQLEASYHWLGVANELIGLVEQHVGKSRGELDQALRDYEGDSLGYQVMRGLTAVLLNRATFASDPPVPPADLRDALFTKRAADVTVGRGEILAETAVRYNITPAQAEAALFADLAEEQLLESVGDPITPADLIARYNLEVARGLLYWASDLYIYVEDGYRDLFKFIKLFGLMYSIKPANSGYEIDLYGPISPFVSSTIRYGLQFAKFLPALLLCQSWQMMAQVRPPGEKRTYRYRLDDSTPLRSHFKSAAGFASQLEANFAAEFETKYNRATRDWLLSYEDELILVGDTVMIPDFALTHRKNGRRALLEIIGYWHPNYLKRKLDKVKKANRADLILLVYESNKVSAEPFQNASASPVLAFKSKPVLKDVLALVEACAV